MSEWKLEDLVQRCTQCEGTGEDPKQLDAPDDLGEFGIVPGGFATACGKCGGHGAEVTPAGELLRGFVRWLVRTNQIPRTD